MRNGGAVLRMKANRWVLATAAGASGRLAFRVTGGYGSIKKVLEEKK